MDSTQDLLVTIVGLLASTIGFAMAFLFTRSRALRAERTLDQVLRDGRRPAVEPESRVDERLDALSSEIERLREGQQFVSKLLVERAHVPVPR